MIYLDQKDDDVRPPSQDDYRERVEQGIYDVMIMEAKSDQVKTGKNAGADKIRVAMRIQKGKFSGRWMWDNVLQWKVKSFILAAGCEPPANGTEINPKLYEGKWARVSVTWNAEWNNITWLSDDMPLKQPARRVWTRANEKKRPAPEPADDEIESDEVPF